jgi:solute carrier family 9 (sodium/hydrogen exchanger), member 8
MSYLIGEALGFSGIISTLFCGFVMRHYAYMNLSPKGKELSTDVIKFIATTADTVIFINLGIAPFAFTETTWDWYTISVTISICLLSRAIVVFPILWCTNIVRRKRDNVDPITWKQQVIIFHAGLRGAVAFVLTLELTDGVANDYWLATVIATILFTVYLLGGTTAVLLKILGLGEEGERSKHITEVNSEYTEVFFAWEKKYIAPLFVSRKMMAELFEETAAKAEAQEEDIKAKTVAINYHRAHEQTLLHEHLLPKSAINESEFVSTY